MAGGLLDQIATRLSAIERKRTSRRIPQPPRHTSPRGAGGDQGRSYQDVGAVPGARRRNQLWLHRGRARSALPPHGHQGRQDHQLPPLPPTPWNASPRDSFDTLGPYEDAVQGHQIFEENDQEHFKGIDIMRTVRSFDPCLPCGSTCTSATVRSWTSCIRRPRLTGD